MDDLKSAWTVIELARMVEQRMDSAETTLAEVNQRLDRQAEHIAELRARLDRLESASG